MSHALQFYIDGQWVDPLTPHTLDVINPATEEPIGRISLGSAADVDRAVAAARAAFETLLGRPPARNASRCSSASSPPTRRDSASSTETISQRNGRADVAGQGARRRRPALGALHADAGGAQDLRVRGAARHDADSSASRSACAA